VSVRVEWMSAATAVEVASAGTEIGEDVVDDLALVFSADAVCVIEGTRSQLRRILDDALKQLDAADPG